MACTQATIAGTLSRDSVFQRIAPSTYALQPIIAHERRKAAAAAKAAKAAEAAAKAEQAAAVARAEQGGKPEADGKAHEDSDDEGVDTVHEAQVLLMYCHCNPSFNASTQRGLPWVNDLLTKDYASLPLATRVDIMSTLVQLALESPSARMVMEERVNAAARIRKQMWEEARVRFLLSTHIWRALVVTTHHMYVIVNLYLQHAS